MKNVVKRVTTACKSCQKVDDNFDLYKLDRTNVVKQGWVKKRGGLLRGSKSRYFVLKSDGALLGFSKNARLVNHFDVKGCQVVGLDKPRNAVYVKFASKLERMFCAESEDDKTEWIDALRSVSDDQDAVSEPSTQMSSLEDLRYVDDDDLEKKEVPFENLESLKLLGMGSYGKVYLCRDKETSRYLAVKKLKKELVIERNYVSGTIRENRVLQATCHPFLIALEKSYQDDTSLYFVMEFANGGDLYFHLMESPSYTFSDDRVRFYAAEVTLGLIYLHDNGIIYRDLKLENILMDKDGHVKIADFGLSKDGMTQESRTTTFCGTTEYLAPEVISLENGGYGFPADWWSLGVIIFEMLIGCLPFYSEDPLEVHRQILKDKLEFPGMVDPEPEDLIQGLLIKDPSKRLGGREVMHHVFFAEIDWEKLYNREIRPPYVPELSSECDLRYFEAQFTEQKTVGLCSFEKRPSEKAKFYIGDEHEFEGFDWVRGE